MSVDQIIESIPFLIILWISLSVHECAHAWAAFRLGDDTAAMLGRMTLNPLAHIDPIGTVLLPLLHIPFGWARPVPVQPHRFYRHINMRTGMMLVALAGPISNLCLAVITLAALAGIARFAPEALVADNGRWFGLVQLMIFMNVLLAAFNILPVPPLDGSRVADALMPRLLRPAWEGFVQLGPFALMAVILLPRMLDVNLFAGPLEFTQSAINGVLFWAASG